MYRLFDIPIHDKRPTSTISFEEPKLAFHAEGTLKFQERAQVRTVQKWLLEGPQLWRTLGSEANSPKDFEVAGHFLSSTS